MFSGILVTVHLQAPGSFGLLDHKSVSLHVREHLFCRRGGRLEEFRVLVIFSVNVKSRNAI